MLKKILIGVGIFLLVSIIALASIPFLFKDKIKEMIVESINKNVDATVAFDAVDLSLLKSFPQANVTIDHLSIINKAPFKGDTLVYFDELNLKMSVKELWKSKTEAMNIKSVHSKNGLVNIHVNKDGVANYDIAIKKEEGKDDGKSDDPLALNIQDYAIENFKIKYYDETSKIKMVIDQLNHKGKGDFAASKLDLTTQTTATVSLDMDQTNFMKNIPITLDAILGIDLDKSLYTFKENKALINQLPLEFDGSIQMVEAGQEYNLTFKTPTSSFKNFLGVIPSAYAGNLDKVQTTGDFTIAGKANGLLSDTTVPKFNVAIASNNASFKYPDLPKSVTNIIIDTKIINETGKMNDTYVNLNKLSFKIDQDIFNAKANIRNLSENALVDASLNGVINLANLSKAYPIKLDKPLTGILKADVVTKFDMKSVETNQYQNIQNSGTMNLSQFKYVDDTNKAININQATVQFTPSRINLQQLDATTGKTDLKVTGVLDNFYGFLFKKQELKGNFDLKSNQFAVADFMTKAEPAKTTEKGDTEKTGTKATASKDAVKIPKFLNCTLTATANTVLYDNLTLKDVSGKMIIKDEAVKLENLKSSIFGGQVAVNGSVSTKEATPTFNMDLGINSFDIAQSFTQLDMLKSIAPIANVINGKMNSTIKLSGKLDSKEMTPDLKTISGDMLAQLLSTTINANNSNVLNALGSNLKFIDLKKVNLNDLKTHLTFSDGKVNVKPFDIKYQDIKVNIGGQHGFDQNMNYDIKFDVPAKYLGSDVTKLLGSLNPNEADKISVPITANLTGNFKSPKVNTDLTKAVTNVTTQLVSKQKDKLINQGTNALGNLLGGKKPADTTKTAPNEDIKTKASDALKGLFSKKKKE
ncbi:AsmA-like C-terminal region-containing protein [Flavobacterium sp. '19STA2R22 D10 B1']|uniref:AsmA-like C-terminal region-containing protein n=1 Tax=Flavobacterium aerium TaxID=3037261 RepID=UPI00278C54EE|nr:AsmA-like C-terminal region-containing protein [Flavobacterium sp. '19STA2R22 D10 B1']